MSDVYGVVVGIGGLLAQSPSPAITPGPEESAAASNIVAGTALGFGVITILMVLFFVYHDRLRTGERLERLVGAGYGVEPTAVSARAIQDVARISILGPGSITVGVRASYRAERGSEQPNVTWLSSDDEIQRQLPGNPAPSVEVTARRSGTFSIQARPAEGTEVAELTVRATEAMSPTQQLPYIGAGWGSIVVGLAIASVTGALGLKGTISAEAVATILGALVGYVVAKGQAETPGRSETSGETKS